MKKSSLKKLALKTEKISDFDSQSIKGGGSWTVLSTLGCIAVKTIISGEPDPEPSLTTRIAPNGATEC